MPKLKPSQNELIKNNFVNVVLAKATLKGISKRNVKTLAFSSYEVGNKRIDHNPGAITLDDMINLSRVLKIPFEELMADASRISRR